MKKEEFYFDSRDGHSRNYAVRYMPDTENVVAVVQIVHGMAEHIGRYEGFAQFLTERGFVVTGEDHLGHGKSVPEGGTYGYFCEQDPATVVVRDVHRLKKMTQQLYPDVPYIILGHSMGSFITRNYICRYGTGISAAIILGTGMQPRAVIKLGKAMAALQKCLYGSKHVAKLIDKAAFAAANSKCEPLRTHADWLTRDTEIVDAFLADDRCDFVFTVNGYQTLFELIDRLYKKENLEKIPKDLPVLMLSGEMDPIGDYGKSVRKAYESLKEAGIQKLQMKLYEDDRHELLNELDRASVMQDIYEWIRNTVLV